MSKEKTVQMVPVDGLKEYARNARTHSLEQVKQIASSITEFGFINPILVDKDLNIIAGHGRLMAARHLGLKTIPALQVDGLTHDQRRAYIIADNKLAENAGWDDDLLKIELTDLETTGFNLELIGFDEDELKGILRDIDTPEDDPNEVIIKDKEQPDTYLVVGEFRVKIDRERYMKWASEVKEKFLFDNNKVLNELIRRLGI